ncbi:MAG: helix-turn-helix domain-containing protein, partial [Verrucomicrobia bacterium]|nr:helix-turn-helix domain-containing protein [Verrucomicrobiota bacterium]
MIGERLEEGRKRKGVTIREASEATKIRGDYLMAMEDNSFDISLPQVYVRGFLKNYARYLKLDPQKVLTDYDAYQLGRTTPPPGRTRASRESLGHMELHRKEEPATTSPETTADQERIVVTEGPPEADDEPEMRFDLRGSGESGGEKPSRSLGS